MKKSVHEIFASIPYGLTPTERMVMLCASLYENENESGSPLMIPVKVIERDTFCGNSNIRKAVRKLSSMGLVVLGRNEEKTACISIFKTLQKTLYRAGQETEKEKTKEESKTENKDKEQEKENTKLCCLRKVQGTFGFPPKPETKTDAEKAPVEPRAQPVAETPSAADTPSRPEAFTLKAEPVKEAAPSRKRPEPRPRDFAEVEDYAKKHGYDLAETDKWYARNVAIGWMMGKNPVKNWKASLAYWMSSAAQSRYQR